MKDTPQQILPDAAQWSKLFSAGIDHSDSAQAKTDWNKKSENFVQKDRKEDYIEFLVKKMALDPHDSVFDMGCGAGTLAIPLAQLGHRVIAADFSEGMLDGLRTYAEERGVAELIETYNNAWQDDLSALPVADVAISSRSLIVDDLADAIAKLEAHARKRCIVTLPCSEQRVFERELGLRPDPAQGNNYRAKTTVILSGYLFSLGRLPKIDYIDHPRASHAENADELIARTLRFAREEYPQDEERIRAFLASHIVSDGKKGGVCYDFTETNRWIYLEWPVPEKRVPEK